jgi:putative transposase
MIDSKRPKLSVRRQCELLGLSRSGLYYEPKPTDPEQLAAACAVTNRRLPACGMVDATPGRDARG